MQVRGLLQLFVEVERTGRHNQFYEKFYIRWDLGRLLSGTPHASDINTSQHLDNRLE